MLLEWAIDETIKIQVRRVNDSIDKLIEFFTGEDTDGDGVIDSDKVIGTIHQFIPDLDNGFCFCNDEDGNFGIGSPLIELVDGYDVTDYFDTSNDYNPPAVSGSNNGYFVDYDGDLHSDDILVPLDHDFTGDGLDDWGWLVDLDDNGLPDANPDLPFFPFGSDEYNTAYRCLISDSGKSIIIVNSDGSMSIYDDSGTLTADDCMQAHDIWLSENAALDKPFSDYSVTEALLFLIFISCIVTLGYKIFKRRSY